MPAQKQGRLAEILQQEYKTKGVFSGAASAGGKRIREMFDIRNYLFSGSGLGSLVGRKIFGKGYSATSTGDASSTISKISSPSPMFSKESIDVLVSIKRDTRISAKNSIVLPAMARDMNLVRQNILKLVKLQGGTAATKADMFFKKASERESAYESQFSNKPVLIQPQPEKNKSKPKGLFDMFSSVLETAFKSALFVVSATLTLMSDTLKSILGVIGNILDFLKGINIPGKLPSSPVGPGDRRTPQSQPRSGSTLGTPNSGQTPSSDSRGPNQPSRTPGKYGGGRGGSRGKASQRFGNVRSGGLTIQGEEAAKSKLEKILKSPKARSKLIEILSKRLAKSAVLTAVLPLIGGTGPIGVAVAAIFTLLSGVLFIDEIISLFDEALSESNSPVNLKEEQQQMANLIYNRFREAGFNHEQATAAVANALAESSLNPNERNQSTNPKNNKKEDSVGLFQMNRMGGLGVNEKTKEPYSVEQLKNPEFNIQLAIDAAKKSKSFMAATTVEDASTALTKDVIRPYDPEGTQARKRALIASNLSSNLGSQLDTASVDSMFQREMARYGAASQNPLIIQDNSSKNMAASQPVSIASAYNSEWERLIELLVDPI